MSTLEQYGLLLGLTVGTIRIGRINPIRKAP